MRVHHDGYVKRRNILIVTVAALSIVIVVGSFVYLNSQKPYAGKVEHITLGINPNEFNSLIYIANDKQYFSNNGLNITIKSYPSGASAVNGMLNKEVDIATATEFVIAEKATQNSRLCAVGSVCKYLNLYVVARTDRGISNIADLEGKTIGVTVGTALQFYLGRFLELNRINQSQVNLFNTSFAQTPALIINGTIDAAITFEPYIHQIGNSKIITWPAQADQFGYYEAICPEDWAAAHPDLIVRFLRALVQAESFNINHQDQAKAIVARDINYTNANISSVWPDFQFSVTLDQSFILLMQDEARWLISNNLTTGSFPNFLDYVYSDGLKTAKPEAVNIIG